jgi:hypothetical protein
MTWLMRSRVIKAELPVPLRPNEPVARPLRARLKFNLQRHDESQSRVGWFALRVVAFARLLSLINLEISERVVRSF